MLLCFAVPTLFPLPADAQQGRRISVIRDAEVEHIIASMAAPLLRFGGMSLNDVTLRVIVDDRLNAFATTGNRIFLNTGLILRTENVDQLRGVVAHEIGHLAGGHLLRVGDQIAQANTTALLGALAGLAAGVAAGRGDVATAVILGGNQAALRGFLAFTRTQENAADAFAMRALDASGYSSRGFLEFFEILGDQELLTAAAQDPYARTHPLSRSRVEAVRAHLTTSRAANAAPPAAEVENHARLQAKIGAFLLPTRTTLQRYPESDQSLPAIYARAIAYYRAGQIQQALPLIDSLIAIRPQDPYFHEMRGQMLVDSQRIAEAVPSYRMAAQLAPRSPLITLSLAHTLVESRDPSLLAEARAATQQALAMDPNNILAWRLSATAHALSGDSGMAAYATAEMHLRRGDFRDAVGQARKAVELLPPNSPARLKAQDLVLDAQRQLDQSRGN